MINGYSSYLTGFASEQAAKDRSHEMGEAFGLPCSCEHDTHMLFPVSLCDWDESSWMLTVEKGYTSYLSEQERANLSPYPLPYTGSFVPFPINMPTFCKIPISYSGNINFDQILEIPENLKCIETGTQILVSYYGDQPYFIFSDITKDAIGLPEYTYEQISHLLI